MKIKIIDLLNSVYEKKMPARILYKFCEYEFDKDENDYKNTDGLLLFEYLFKFERKALFLEVEIIEEKPKKVNEAHYFYSYSEYNEIKHEVDKVLYIVRGLNRLEDKTKDLAKAVNYLLEKSDKDDKD
mgnify:CR=1 FL=1